MPEETNVPCLIDRLSRGFSDVVKKSGEDEFEVLRAGVDDIVNDQTSVVPNIEVMVHALLALHHRLKLRRDNVEDAELHEVVESFGSSGMNQHLLKFITYSFEADDFESAPLHVDRIVETFYRSQIELPAKSDGTKHPQRVVIECFDRI